MKKFKQFRKLGFSSLFFLLCMLAFMPANAQRLANADILTTHVDRANKKMYVEMNFYAPSCGEHQVRFFFCHATGTDTLFNGAIMLDSVLTNQHNAGSPRIDTITNNVVGSHGYDSVMTVLRLDNTAVGGYHLRFDVKDSLLFDQNPANMPQLCMDVTRLALHCKYCGVERTSLVLDPLTIDEACPYKYKDSILYGKDTMLFYEDLITCRKREGSLAKNWEAFIQDPRDCRTYRIVQMPDSNWWFAQNLNFQSYPSNKKAKYNNRATSYNGATGSSAVVDTLKYWCPGPDSGIASNGREDTTTANKWPCEVYGALYNAHALYFHDGYGDSLSIDKFYTLVMSATSGKPNIIDSSAGYIKRNKRVRAICPPEWFVPSDADWGIMLNAAEGCLNPDSINNTANIMCNHIRTRLDTGNHRIAFTTPTKGGNLGTLGTHTWGATGYISFNFYNLGQNTGRYLRATPTCSSLAGNCDDAPNANPTQGLIHAAGNPDTAQAKSSWAFAGSNNAGTDMYGFSVLPAGFLTRSNVNNAGVNADDTQNRYYGRGYHAIFLTSTFTRTSSTYVRGKYSPLMRIISYNRNDVGFFYYRRNDNVDGAQFANERPAHTNAYSVRCIKPQKDWAKNK